MRRPTQFDLRTLGLLLFCFSVGLAASTGRTPGGFGWRDSIYGMLWMPYNTLLITGATAMVIGLVQQVVVLTRAEPETNSNRPAINFAIGWRIAVAILLAVSLVLEVGLARQLINLPESEESGTFFYGRLVPEYVTFFCMMLVLVDSLGDRRRVKIGRWLQVLFWPLALVFAFLALAEAMQVTYLVYKALAGVEAAQTPRLQRPGAYPNFPAEGYWLFRFALAAAASSLAGSGALLSVFCWPRKNGNEQVMVGAFGLILLGMSAAFGYWFLLYGLPRIAPDFAEAGWGCTWWEWVEAAAVLAIAIPAAAYRLTADSSQSFKVEHQAAPQMALHQSWLVSLVLALAALFFGLSLLQIYNIFDSGSWPNATVSRKFYWMFTTIIIYVPLAVSLLSVQFFWKQWRTPADHTNRITPIRPRRFLLACAALIVILVLSIPTISAFCFAYWVSPWS